MLPVHLSVVLLLLIVLVDQTIGFLGSNLHLWIKTELDHPLYNQWYRDFIIKVQVDGGRGGFLGATLYWILVLR